MSTPASGTHPDIKEYFSRVLDLPPNCLEFSPFLRDHFVIGSYHLEKDPDEKQDEREDEADIEDKLKHLGIEDKPEDGEPSTAGPRIQKRSGSLELCKLVAKSTPNGSPGIEVVTLQKFLLPSAVYDLHFSGDFLITTSTTGSMSIFYLVFPDKVQPDTIDFSCHCSWFPVLHGKARKEAEIRSCFFQDAELAYIPQMSSSSSESDEVDYTIHPAHLRHIGTYQKFDRSTLVIAAAWHPTMKSVFAICQSDGHVHVFGLQATGPQPDAVWVLLELGVVHSHSESAWCVTWGYPCFNKDREPITNLYSGGDDSKVVVTRLTLNRPANAMNLKPRTLEFSEAGVTALEMFRGLEDEDTHTDFLLTGSYDNKVRVVCVISPKTQTGVLDPGIVTSVLATLDLGGTIHKLKYLCNNRARPGEPGKIGFMASCAHIGVRLLLVTMPLEGPVTIEVVAKFEGHASLNYASGIILKDEIEDPKLKEVAEKDNVSLYVSTSFYDRLMCVWGFKDYWA